MEINETPSLIGDSIIFRDDDGFFIYGQNQKKVAWLKDIDNQTIVELREKSFFAAPENIYILNQRAASLMLLLGKNCPLRCRYCYVNSDNTNTELMSVEIADQAVAYYLAGKPLRPKVILFAGGEPTLNIKAIQHVVGKYGKAVNWGLTTSGVLPLTFLIWLIERGVSITFSIDGPPEIQNYLRPLKNGEPSSKIVERSITTWVEKATMPLSVRATITDDTARDIDHILKYFEALAVKKVHLEPLYNLGRAVEQINSKTVKQVPPEKWVEVVVRALIWAREKKKYVQIGALNFILRPALFSYCGPMCGKTVVVNHKGELTACSEVVDDGNKEWDLFSIGKLKSGFEFDEQKLQKFAGRVTDKMISCKNCFAKYLCRGGCAHKGWEATNDIFLPDPHHCDFIKAVVPLLVKRMATKEYSHYSG